MQEYIPRELESSIHPWLGEPKILIIKGVRQAGKTTLIKKIEQDLKSKGQATFFFSIDFEINNPLFTDPKLFVRFLELQAQDRFLYVFLDEFQYLTEAGRFLKAIFDVLKEKIQLIISGSSSLEITKNSEFLTGRKIEFHLSPFTFKEFLTAKSPYRFQESFSWNSFEEIREFDLIYQQELKQQLAEYVQWGGYPEVVRQENIEKKQTILRELVSTYIQKDVAGFLKVEKVQEFNTLVALLAAQTGNLVKKDELGHTISLNKDTINKYLSILQGTYVLDFVKPLYRNVRKELTKMPKVYLNDLGLCRVLQKRWEALTPYEELEGKMIENFVYLQLKTQFSKEPIYFYRTLAKAEIDFVVGSQQEFLPIEVKFRNKVPQTLPVVMKNFQNHYPILYSMILTKSFLQEDTDRSVFFLPCYLLPFIRMSR